MSPTASNFRRRSRATAENDETQPPLITPEEEVDRAGPGVLQIRFAELPVSRYFLLAYLGLLFGFHVGAFGFFTLCCWPWNPRFRPPFLAGAATGSLVNILIFIRICVAIIQPVPDMETAFRILSFGVLCAMASNAIFILFFAIRLVEKYETFF